jgi:hypothetical protein
MDRIDKIRSILSCRRENTSRSLRIRALSPSAQLPLDDPGFHDPDEPPVGCARAGTFDKPVLAHALKMRRMCGRACILAAVGVFMSHSFSGWGSGPVRPWGSQRTPLMNHRRNAAVLCKLARLLLAGIPEPQTLRAFSPPDRQDPGRGENVFTLAVGPRG